MVVVPMRTSWRNVLYCGRGGVSVCVGEGRRGIPLRSGLGGLRLRGWKSPSSA